MKNKKSFFSRKIFSLVFVCMVFFSTFSNSVKAEVTVGENLESEFSGTLTDVLITNDDSGEVVLDNNKLGTYTFGGSNSDYGNDITTDSSGNIFINGHFKGTVDFDPTNGIDNHTSQYEDSFSAFITKYNADGSYGWTRIFGGGMRSSNFENDIALNSSGDIFITGSFEGTVDFDGTGGVDNHTSTDGPFNDEDVFITKYNADGSYGWTRTFGDENFDTGNGIAINSLNEVLVTGNFFGEVDFDGTAGVDNLGATDDKDIFITKYGSDGSYIWTRVFGGYHYEYSDDIAVNSLGDIFITGLFEDTANFDGTGGTDNHTAASGSEYVFITKYNADGSYGWTRTFGGGEDTYNNGRGIVINSSDEVLVTGFFSGITDFDGTVGIDNHSSYELDGSQDIFITKYNTDGSYDWTRTFGGNYNEYAEDITINSLDDIFVTGAFEDAVNFDGTGGIDSYTAVNEIEDSFITKYNADGSYGWTRTFGAESSGDYGINNAIAINLFNEIFVIGNFINTVDFDASAEIDNRTSDGSDDVFLTKYNADGSYGHILSDYTETGTYQAQINSQVINIKQWNQFIANQTTPTGTIISYEILDETCTTTLIPKTTDTTIDLSGIDVSNTSLCLEVTFESTDVSVTPKLNDWNTTFERNPMPAYRFYSSKTGDHFYTNSESEKDFVINDYSDYKYEGVVFYVYENQEINTTPVYRFYSSKTGDHFYTNSESEKDFVINDYSDYKYEGVVFYVYENQEINTTPVYRFYSSKTGDHFYTNSESEKDFVINDYSDYKYEGVVFYTQL